MFLGSVTRATSFIRPLQAGHSRTSIANVRRKSSARFVDRPIAATRVAIARWVHSALVVGEANAWLWWWYSGNTTNEGLIQQSGSVTTKRYYTVRESVKPSQIGPVDQGTFIRAFCSACTRPSVQNLQLSP
jgi:O-glycosyl hydrolase